MKSLKFLIILSTLLLSFRAEDQPPAESGEPADPPAGESEGEGGEKKEALVGHCNKALLEAYDIESGWETVEDKNFLCPSIKKLNCCSYHAQMDIFRKWVMKGEREKVLNVYRYNSGCEE